MLRTPPLPVTHLGAGDRSRTLTWAKSSTSAEPPIDIATHYVRPHVATADRTCPDGAGPAGPSGPPRRPGRRPRRCGGPGPRRSCRCPRSRPGATVPNPPSQPSNPAYPAALTGNSWTPSSPPTGSSAAATCAVGVGVHAAGNRACLYDGHRHPFLWLRDGTHPLAVGPVNPGLLPRPGRSDRHAGGCQKTWDPADKSIAGQPETASAD